MLRIFIATSKRFYPEAKHLVARLKASGHVVYHPYFELDSNEVEASAESKREVTLRHFPEIDESEMVYGLTPKGYVGCSVTIEMTYAFAKGKRVLVSEWPSEFALHALVSEVCEPALLVEKLRQGAPERPTP